MSLWSQTLGGASLRLARASPPVCLPHEAGWRKEYGRRRQRRLQLCVCLCPLKHWLSSFKQIWSESYSMLNEVK